VKLVRAITDLRADNQVPLILCNSLWNLLIPSPLNTWVWPASEACTRLDRLLVLPRVAQVKRFSSYSSAYYLHLLCFNSDREGNAQVHTRLILHLHLCIAASEIATNIISASYCRQGNHCNNNAQVGLLSHISDYSSPVNALKSKNLTKNTRANVL